MKNQSMDFEYYVVFGLFFFTLSGLYLLGGVIWESDILQELLDKGVDGEQYFLGQVPVLRVESLLLIVSFSFTGSVFLVFGAV